MMQPAPCACCEAYAREKLSELRGPIIPVRLGSTGADAPLLGPEVGLELVGFSVTENAGAAARLGIRDGQGGANDIELFAVTLAAGESSREWFASGDEGAGIPISHGLFILHVSGTYGGTFFVRKPRAPMV